MKFSKMFNQWYSPKCLSNEILQNVDFFKSEFKGFAGFEANSQISICNQMYDIKYLKTWNQGDMKLRWIGRDRLNFMPYFVRKQKSALISCRLNFMSPCFHVALISCFKVVIYWVIILCTSTVIGTRPNIQIKGKPFRLFNVYLFSRTSSILQSLQVFFQAILQKYIFGGWSLGAGWRTLLESFFAVVF